MVIGEVEFDVVETKDELVAVMLVVVDTALVLLTETKLYGIFKTLILRSILLCHFRDQIT